MKEDYYIILGISRTAAKNTIKRAFRNLAKLYHPDSGGSHIDETKFREVQQAYETLIDTNRRAQYDEELHERSKLDRVHYVRNIAPPRGVPLTRDPFPGSIIEEFFDGRLFDTRPLHPFRRFDNDLAIEIILDLDEALNGGLFPVSVPVATPCMHCDQSGFQYPYICPNCRGYGQLREERQFSISIPPKIKNNTEVSIPLDDIGLKGVDLHILIRVEDYGF